MIQDERNSEGAPLRDHATHEQSRSVSALRVGIVSALLALTACHDSGETRAYWEHPQDAEVQQYALERCLERARGPSSVHYNDFDEAMEICAEQADDVARYCPDKGMTPPCLPQYQRSREDVRMMLPKHNQEPTNG